MRKSSGSEAEGTSEREVRLAQPVPHRSRVRPARSTRGPVASRAQLWTWRSIPDHPAPESDADSGPRKAGKKRRFRTDPRRHGRRAVTSSLAMLELLARSRSRGRSDPRLVRDRQNVREGIELHFTPHLTRQGVQYTHPVRRTDRRLSRRRRHALVSQGVDALVVVQGLGTVGRRRPRPSSSRRRDDPSR